VELKSLRCQRVKSTPKEATDRRESSLSGRILEAARLLCRVGERFRYEKDRSSSSSGVRYSSH
jgi:hypothetical protein